MRIPVAAPAAYATGTSLLLTNYMSAQVSTSVSILAPLFLALIRSPAFWPLWDSHAVPTSKWLGASSCPVSVMSFLVWMNVLENPRIVTINHEKIVDAGKGYGTQGTRIAQNERNRI